MEKSSLSTVFLLVILCNSTFSDGCFKNPDCKNALPERINWWRSKEYGLEITGDRVINPNLNSYEKWVENRVNEIVPSKMKSEIENLIQKNRKQGFPDFTINKLDPISYTFKEKKMLITLTNVKIINLDNYDKESAKYSQTAVYEEGEYEVKPEMYDRIKKEKNGKKGAGVYKRITLKNGKNVLNRTDVRWTVNVKGNFQTDEENDLRPIVIATNFKIQPDIDDENDAADDREVLRSRGKVRIEFHGFKFDANLIITHIDEPLRPFFDELIKSENLTPDLDITYGMREIKILEDSIKLLPYDKDNTFPKIIDRKEDVNANLPDKEQKSKITSKKESPPPEQTNFYENNVEKNLVAKHFEVLKKLILENSDDIARRLSVNLIPKMAWKIMHLETKKQLPYLFHEILVYDDEFHEKSLVQSFTLMASLNQGFNMVKELTKFRRSELPPATLESL